MIVRAGARLGLAVWLVAILLLTLQPAHPRPGQEITDNFILFRTFAIYLANLESPFWVGQWVGNLLLFVPLGVLGPRAFRALDGPIRVVVAGLLLSLLIEVAQLWVPQRSADVDDVILNVAGALLGYVILSFMRTLRRERHQDP